jgi:hypothetical protein
MLWNNEIKSGDSTLLAISHWCYCNWILWRLVEIDYCVWGGTNEREV